MRNWFEQHPLGPISGLDLGKGGSFFFFPPQSICFLPPFAETLAIVSIESGERLLDTIWHPSGWTPRRERGMSFSSAPLVSHVLLPLSYQLVQLVEDKVRLWEPPRAPCTIKHQCGGDAHMCKFSLVYQDGRGAMRVAHSPYSLQASQCTPN